MSQGERKSLKEEWEELIKNVEKIKERMPKIKKVDELLAIQLKIDNYRLKILIAEYQKSLKKDEFDIIIEQNLINMSDLINEYNDKLLPSNNTFQELAVIKKYNKIFFEIKPNCIKNSFLIFNKIDNNLGKSIKYPKFYDIVKAKRQDYDKEVIKNKDKRQQSYGSRITRAGITEKFKPPVNDVEKNSFAKLLSLYWGPIWGQILSQLLNFRKDIDIKRAILLEIQDILYDIEKDFKNVKRLEAKKIIKKEKVLIMDEQKKVAKELIKTVIDEDNKRQNIVSNVVNDYKKYKPTLPSDLVDDINKKCGSDIDCSIKIFIEAINETFPEIHEDFVKSQFLLSGRPGDKKLEFNFKQFNI
jgi:hypothetical protein